MTRQSISDLSFDVSGQLWLPSVTVGQEFLLVVEQFLMGHGSVFKVGSFDNRVNGTSSLAESAINAFGHVNIVLGGSSGSIGPGLALNSDGFCGACSGTEFASDTPWIRNKKTFLHQWHIFWVHVRLWTWVRGLPFHRGSEWSTQAQRHTRKNRTTGDKTTQGWSTI